MPSGEYTLTAQLKDGAEVIAEINEYFSKPYEGIPEVGIDENNAIRVNGELFFPLTPWGLNDLNFDEWIDEYINSLYVTGFWLEGNNFDDQKTINSWQYYLSEAQRYGARAVGPGYWEGVGPRHYERNSDINKLKEYVNACHDNPGMLAWMWKDEPDLGTGNQYVPGPVVRSWTYQSHKLDPQRLSAINYAGHGIWTRDNPYGRRSEFAYMHTKKYFGKKTFLCDIYTIDYYPIDWAPPSLRNASLAKLADCLDRLKAETHNLIPYMSFVETTDINENEVGGGPPPTPWNPTPEQIKMLAWVNVVHGVKGICWFHHRTRTPAENKVAMAEFLDQITMLTPVVLGPEVDIEVTDNSNETGNRVDTMVRVHEGFVYLFAVRLTESDETGQPADQSDVITTFNISGAGSGSAQVFNEDRAIPLSGGTFTDTFAPNAVHIYKMTSAVLPDPDPDPDPESEPQPEPEAEPESEPQAEIPEVTELKCYNNVYKANQSMPV